MKRKRLRKKGKKKNEKKETEKQKRLAREKKKNYLEKKNALLTQNLEDWPEKLRRRRKMLSLSYKKLKIKQRR